MNDTVGSIGVDVSHSLQHIQNVIDMFQSNKILSEPVNTIFISIYLLLAILAGKSDGSKYFPEAFIITNTCTWLIKHI